MVKSVTILMLYFSTTLVLQIDGRILKGVQNTPPEPKYGFNELHSKQYDYDTIQMSISSWDPEEGNFVWELSGLNEGDIMLYNNLNNRNGLVDEKSRWTNSTVAFYIDEDDFTDDQVKIILKAMDEYHEKTCIRFRPYEKSDENYIVVKGNSSGCWSSVGMQDGGQVVHLQKDGCVRHGVVVHELLHALGFYHQQSATERDEYVKILYENISPGREHNFNKYNHTYVTSYNVSYDYTSVMHYSEKAFSKNGKNTIESVVPNQKLGQRNGLSDKDIIKLNKMYESVYCHPKIDNVSEIHFSPLYAIVQWFESLFMVN